MSGSQVVKKILDDKITIYTRNNSHFYQYYFTHQNQVYRGSTKSKNLDESERISIRKYDNLVGKGIKPKSGKNIRDCIEYFFIDKSDIKEITRNSYKRQSRFILEYFDEIDKNFDPNTINHGTLVDYEKWRLNYYKAQPKKMSYKYKRGNHTVKLHKNFKISPSSVSNEIVLLQNILRYCNNTDFITIAKIPYKKRPPVVVREETLNKTEYLKLKKYFLDKKKYYHWSIISFIVNSSCRFPSEVNSLQYKNINLEKERITLTRKGRFGSQKKWTIPLVGTCKDIIMQLKSREGFSSEPDDFVFVKNSKGEQIKSISWTFKKAVRECGIKKKLCPYHLRHTYATKMISTRPDLSWAHISASMGHANTRYLQSVYGHLRPGDLVKFFQRSEKTREKIKKEREEKRILQKQVKTLVKKQSITNVEDNSLVPGVSFDI